MNHAELFPALLAIAVASDARSRRGLRGAEIFYNASMKPRTAFLPNSATLSFMVPAVVLLFLFLAVGDARADSEIYRCETPDGLVFSDEPCSDAAQLIEVEDHSSGISGGPPEEVRNYLAEQRDAREQERKDRLQARAMAPPPAPPPQIITVEQPVFYPGYWWRPQRPPHHRPKPERPQRPVEPPGPPTSGNVMRPRR
jgi:hypothetical protein